MQQLDGKGHKLCFYCGPGYLVWSQKQPYPPLGHFKEIIEIQNNNHFNFFLNSNFDDPSATEHHICLHLICLTDWLIDRLIMILHAASYAILNNNLDGKQKARQRAFGEVVSGLALPQSGGMAIFPDLPIHMWSAQILHRQPCIEILSELRYHPVF